MAVSVCVRARVLTFDPPHPLSMNDYGRNRVYFRSFTALFSSISLLFPIQECLWLLLAVDVDVSDDDDVDELMRLKCFSNYFVIKIVVFFGASHPAKSHFSGPFSVNEPYVVFEFFFFWLIAITSAKHIYAVSCSAKPRVHATIDTEWRTTLQQK